MTKSPSKKRGIITLAKYRELQNKRPKASSTSSNPMSSTCSSFTTLSRPSFYQVYLKEQGIDLSSFQSSIFDSYCAPTTITSRISQTLNSKYLYPDRLNTDTPTSSIKIDSKIPLPLVNKNRCVVEDFMFLPSNTEVTILIPKPKKSDQSISIASTINIECYDSFFQFGNSKNTKYLIFSGSIVSSPYYDRVVSNGLTPNEISNALRSG